MGADLGSYEIIELLGQGGFGKVYKARDKTLGRDVAIKFLHSTVDLRRQKLFEREAKAIAALSKHPNIVAIHQWGEYEDQNYFVLEFVEGNAEKLLEEHQEGLPLALALRIAAECALGLHEAHKQNILHRDIKPANILIEPDNGAVKLTDFGLATFGPSSKFTIDGTVSGSPSYMSPEQANAEQLDRRTDIFSLGVTLYELLCGRLPFEGHTAEETLARIRQNERVLLRSRRPDLPEAVCAIVEKATAFARPSRYQTAQEFARALRIALQGLERSGVVASEPAPAVPEAKAPQEQPKWRRRASRAVIGLAAVVLAMVLLVSLSYLFPGVGERVSGKTALAAANEHMERKEFPEAANAYQEYLQQDAQSSSALHGLALALAGEGRFDDATETMNRIQDENLRAEVAAVLAFETQRPDARQEIEQAAATAQTKYPQVLLARLNALDGKEDQVIQQLSNLSANQFSFGYQYAEALQTLGQAYYHLNKFAEAKAAFDELSQVPVPGLREIANAYSAEIARKRDDSRREEVRAAARRISEQIQKQEVQSSSVDDWTSRPLTFFILPVEAGRCRYAVESGLVDLLPTMLGGELDAKTTMNLVDREIINELLAEQELSAFVGSKEGQLQLGRVLGARIILKLNATAAGGKEKLVVKADNVETTEQIPIPTIELQRNMEPEAVAAVLKDSIWQEISRQFPIQGRLYLSDNGPETNIGADVGVAQGMTFQILSDRDAPPIGDATASVQGSPGANLARLVVTGIDIAKLGKNPEQGWYIRQKS
jgi:tetratricopeptide (TPR) repeat protein/tRNA A-37 threonylcarbamoyl transferase component Bud32